MIQDKKNGSNSADEMNRLAAIVFVDYERL